MTPLLPRQIAITPKSKSVPWNVATDNNVPIPDNRPETEPLVNDVPEEPDFKPEIKPEHQPKPKKDNACCTIL